MTPRSTKQQQKQQNNDKNITATNNIQIANRLDIPTIFTHLNTTTKLIQEKKKETAHGTTGIAIS